MHPQGYFSLTGRGCYTDDGDPSPVPGVWGSSKNWWARKATSCNYSSGMREQGTKLQSVPAQHLPE